MKAFERWCSRFPGFPLPWLISRYNAKPAPHMRYSRKFKKRQRVGGDIPWRDRAPRRLDIKTAIFLHHYAFLGMVWTAKVEGLRNPETQKHVGHDVTFGKGGLGGRCSDCHEDLTEEQGEAVRRAEDR